MRGDPAAYANWQDIDLKRTFVSCPDMAAIPEEFWANSQPDNYVGTEDVVVFYFDTNFFGYGDISTESRSSALCEVNIKQNKTT